MKQKKLHTRRNALTAQITELRKQRNIANGVIKRAEEIHDKLDIIHEQEIDKLKVAIRKRRIFLDT